ncbi:Listeria/Bacterioides repeat [Candidatus Nanopelagicaceae bacterium]
MKWSNKRTWVKLSIVFALIFQTLVSITGIETAQAVAPSTWVTRSAQTTTGMWSGVAYGNGTFVAVSSAGSIMTSSDNGVTWVSRTGPAGYPTAAWKGIAFGNGRFVAIKGERGSVNNAMYSTDNGATWTISTTPASDGNGSKSISSFPTNFQNITFSTAGGVNQFLAVSVLGINGNNGVHVIASSDGVTWSTSDLGFDTTWGAAGCSSSYCVVLNGQNNGSNVSWLNTSYSSNGSTWTNIGSIPAGPFTSVAYGNGKYVALGSRNWNAAIGTSQFAGNVIYNSDTPQTAANWIKATLSQVPQNYWTWVVFANGYFVAVSNDGQVMTSANGVDWTLGTAASASAWQSVAYGGGTFVAVGGTNNVMTSTVGLAPSAPTIGTATTSNSTTASIPFTPGSDNGSAITSYSITSSPAIALTYSGTTSPFTVTGSFASCQAYTFTITATNEFGTSTASSASNSITPNTTCTMVFDANTGSGTMANQSITSGVSTALTSNTYTKSGYSFVNWTTNADGSGTSYSNGQSITRSTGATLYAQWTKIKTTGLVVNLDTMNPQSLASGSTTWVNALPGTSISSQAPGAGSNITRSTVNGVNQLNFDGNADYYQYSTVADSRITGAMSLEMWINPSSLTNGWNILATRWFSDLGGTQNTSYDWHFAIRPDPNDSNKLKLNLYTTSNSDMFGSQVFTAASSLNKWYLVGFTLDASGNLNFYINGVQDGTTKTGVTHIAQTASIFNIGDSRANVGGFIGAMSKVRLYNTGLTAADELANYDAEYATYLQQKVTFNSNDGVTPTNSSQYIYKSTATNLTTNLFTRTGYTFGGWNTLANGTGTSYTNGQSVTITSDLTLYAQWNAIVNGSLLFGANSSSYLTIPNSSNLKFGTNNFTVEWWQYQTDSSNWPRIFEAKLGATREIAVSIESNIFYWWSGGAALCRADVGTGNKNAWHHFAVSRSGATTKVFRDGVQLCSFADTKDYQPTSELKIGAEIGVGTNTYFGGNLTNFHWVNGTALYSAAFTRSNNPISLVGNSKILLNVQNQANQLIDLTGLNTVTNNASAVSWSTMTPFTAITQTITYAAGTGGAGSAPTTPTSVSYGSTFTTPANTYSRTGYSFAGWSDGSAIYAASVTYPSTGTVTANVTLTATWTANTLAITYNSQSGSAIANGSTTTGGSISASPGTPTRSGYTFNGWFAAATGGSAIVFPYTHGQTADFTLYAQWTALTCAQGGTCSVGQIGPAGGIVIYVGSSTINQVSGISTGGIYLEAAPTGFSATTYNWCDGPNNGNTTLIGANGSTLGTGASNTAIMVAKCSGGAGNVAANYSKNGYSDWFLPSAAELVYLSAQKTAVGLGSSSLYWGSNEGDTWVAASLVTSNGGVGGQNKAQATPLWPIRAFSPGDPVPAPQVAITRAAFGTQRRTAFTTQPQITIQDASSNTNASSSAVVTATISAGGTLVGTTTATASSGIATFTNLGVDGTIGSTYTITYSSPGLTSATATVTLTATTCDGATFTCQVGDTGPGGGKIFYVAPGGGTFACGQTLSSLCIYLEAAPTTGASAWTDNRYAWSGNINTSIGSTSTAIGAGYSNTLKMVRQVGAGTAGAGSAARGYRGGGLNDWYLPSKDELNQITLNQALLSATAGYWSSSEATATGAWDQGSNGAQGVADPGKQQTTPVRPIRAFGSSAIESAIIYVPAIAGVTAPVRGATPVTTVTAANGYTGTVSWSGSPSTFAGGTTYTATITLSASSGFTLTGVTTNFFTVASATSVTHSADSGTITAVFPATDGVPAAPTIGTVTATNKTTISVPYTAGSSNGSSITGYTVTSSPSVTLTLTSSATANPLTFTGTFVQGQAYTFSMTATNGNGTSSSSSASNSITVYPANPTITSLDVTSGVKTGATTVTITGTNLGDTTGITVGGNAATLGSVGSTSVTFTTPASATTGAKDVVLSTVNSSATKTGGFTYYDTLTPSCSGGGTITIVNNEVTGHTSCVGTATIPEGVTSIATGSNPCATPSLGISCNAYLTSVILPSTLKVINAKAFADTGLTGNIVIPSGVTTIGDSAFYRTGNISTVIPASVTSFGSSVFYRSNVTSVSFESGSTIAALGSNSFYITFNLTSIVLPDSIKTIGALGFNSNLTNGLTTVTMNGVTSIASDAFTALTCVVTNGTNSYINSYVFANSPIKVDSISKCPQPTFTSMSVAAGSTAGGNSTVITGTNLANLISVTIGGTSTTVTAKTRTTVTITVPSGTAGSKDIVITTEAGAVTAAAAYRYAGAPTYSSISVNSGSTAGGTATTITGTNLLGATAVTVGGAAATIVSTSDTQIEITTPVGTSGAKNIVITTPGGTVTATSAFTYQSAGLTPTFGTPTSTADGFTVSITNYDAAFTWATPTVNSGSVAITSTSGSTRVLTVTGLSPGASATITQDTSRTNYTNGSATVIGAATQSNVATLSGLAISVGTLSPTFASGTTGYTASVANTTSSLTVTPTRTQANATITVNGTTVASGVASGSISLSVGSNTINVVVTAQDGTTTSTYTVTVTRDAAVGAAITTQPTGATSGSVLGTQPVIRIVDAAGSTVTSSTVNVVASIASGTGTLSGTTTVAAVSGVATFTNLVITGTPGTFTLTFTPTSLTPVTSNSLSITAASCSPTSSVAFGYTIYKFTNTGTCIWTVPNGLTNVEILAVAGGGGGGYSWGNSGAGGGGGGQVKTTQATLSATLEVTVGAGGSAGIISSGRGGSGGDSIVSTITALGGTGGCGLAAPTCSVASMATASAAANGGAGAASPGNGTSGKGGGGSSLTLPVTGTNVKGQGTSSDYSGSAVTYGYGGTGGSPKGSSPNVAGTAGGVNTGNGGDGAATNSASNGNSSLGADGGAGGSGVVIVRYGNTLTITYDAKGGTTASGGSTTTVTGGTVSTLPTTSRTGYAFNGWFTSATGGTQITTSAAHNFYGNFTLYAQWSANTLTITYDSQSGSAISNGSTTTGGSISASPGTPTRTGYTFNGWFAAATGGTQLVFPYTHNRTANFTLYAQWSANALTITYDSQSGSAISNGSTTTDGSISASPGTPTRDGYTFNGWFASATGGTAIGFPYTHNQTASFTLYAQWSVNSYTITFDANGASGGTSASVSYGSNAFTSAPNLSRTDYSFAGWSETSSGAVITSWNVVGTKTLYAIWTPAFVVTFVSAGTAVDPITYTGTALAKPTDPSRTGYTFAGWKNPSNATVTWSYTPTASITLTAAWTINTYTITITQTSNGSISPTSATVDYGTDQLFTFTPTTGYSVASITVDGAALSSAALATAIASGYSFTNVTATHSITATYAAIVYRVTLESPHATVAQAIIDYTVGSEGIILPYRIKADYVFLGWYTQVAGGGTLIGIAGERYTPTASVTLYSHWIQETLYGIDPAKLSLAGDIRASSSQTRTLLVEAASSSVSVRVPAGALPEGTYVEVYSLSTDEYSRSKVTADGAFIVNLVVAWHTAEELVPVATTPIVMTVRNATIKKGADVYAIQGQIVKKLATATVDGEVVVLISEDPIITVTNPVEAITNPTPPTQPVAATGGGGGGGGGPKLSAIYFQLVDPFDPTKIYTKPACVDIYSRTVIPQFMGTACSTTEGRINILIADSKISVRVYQLGNGNVYREYVGVVENDTITIDDSKYFPGTTRWIINVSPTQSITSPQGDIKNVEDAQTQADKIIEEAKKQAVQILETARNEIKTLTDSEATKILDAATSKAAKILDDANAQAAKILADIKAATATPTPVKPTPTPTPTPPVTKPTTTPTTPTKVVPKVVTISCKKGNLVKTVSGTSPKCPSGYSQIKVVAPKPTPTPTKASTKSITITCVKGALSRKVTGLKPTCPTGFTKKS